MALLQCYVDDMTMEHLRHCSRHLGRSVEDLAESAIAEAALQAVRDTALKAVVASGEYCPVCHNNPNQQGHGQRCTG